MENFKNNFLGFDSGIAYAKNKLVTEGKEVKTKTWHQVEISEPMWEVLDVGFKCTVGKKSIVTLQDEIKPNMPWAENHLSERVGGIPLNPGEEYKNWPFYKRDSEMRTENGKFSHSYMERIWPKFAGKLNDEDYSKHVDWHIQKNKGIRYNYGDLNDLIILLIKDPYTRQAYLPIWFPEDTGSVNNQRVPCTLGYHFIMRDNKLHITYYIRSCDYLRHFRDDIYLAARLLQWVLEMLKIDNMKFWSHVSPGDLNMYIVSLHIFKNELELVKRFNK